MKIEGRSKDRSALQARNKCACILHAEWTVLVRVPYYSYFFIKMCNLINQGDVVCTQLFHVYLQPAVSKPN